MLRAPPSRLSPLLLLAALGIVFGDIGTSPLYAFREAFSPLRGLSLTPEHVYAVLSMMFWAITLVVSVKYLAVLLRFDNRGEGGMLALLSIATARVQARPGVGWVVGIVGVAAAAFFYGDALVTPAISVLAAVEGVSVVAPELAGWILPITIALLSGLFVWQSRGPSSVRILFGPFMVFWFLVLAGLGIANIVQSPEVLQAVDPRFAIGFARDHPGLTVVALAAVILCVAGAEILYADLGRYGPHPIRLAWFILVFPCLMLNYLGQGALVLREPTSVANPFFFMAPDFLRWPLVVLATAATLIATQAVISGVFAATQQASRLNYLPRLKVSYLSDLSQGQVYIPTVNWLLFAGVVALVLGFRSSQDLAAVYGLAVSGTLVAGSLLLGITVVLLPGRAYWLMLPGVAVIALLEFAFLGANIWKIGQGAWLPLSVALVMFVMLTTWRRGTEIMRAKKESRPNRTRAAHDMDLSTLPRVPGTAVFFSSTRTGYPASFLHNLKHNKVMHEQTVFLTIQFDDIPRVADEERIQLQRVRDDVIRLVAHFGYREDPDVLRALKLARRKGLEVDPDQASFFTSKPVVVSVSRRGPFGWRRSLFGWMLQNSPSVASYFGLPPGRVIELGSQVGI
jgi:KUP system potassium uptake protein